MEPDYNEEIKYLRVKKRIEDLKGFYIHLAVYIIVNIFISGVQIIEKATNEESISEIFSNFDVYGVWIFWGIGIAFHTLKVFGFDFFLGKDWEERKIKEFMDK